jgi:hypothetical protein
MDRRGRHQSPPPEPLESRATAAGSRAGFAAAMAGFAEGLAGGLAAGLAAAGSGFASAAETMRC